MFIRYRRRYCLRGGRREKVGEPVQIADPSQSDQGAEHVSGAELTIRYPAFHIITKSRDFWKEHEDWNLCTSAMFVNVTVKQSTIGPTHFIYTIRDGHSWTGSR